MAREIDPLTFTTMDELVTTRLTKSQNRRLQILEHSIRLFAERGIESTRYEDIAKRCKVSRALVQHYFPAQEDLALTALKVIRARFQKLAIEAITAQPDPRAQVAAYVDSTFAWIRDHAAHAKVWLLFYYYCGVKKEYRALNTALVDQGHARIVALLRRGVEAAQFPDGDLEARAKRIQNAITVGLLTALTEEREGFFERAWQDTRDYCLDQAVRGRA